MIPAVPKSKRTDLEDICTPIFDAPMGARLALMRKRNLWDQAQLGMKLGLAAQTISEIEGGRRPIPRHAFTVSKLRDVFGDETGFILLGHNAGRYNASAIERNFFETKFQTARKRRPDPVEHWTSRALRENYPRRQ